MSRGDLMVFVARPISLAMLLATIGVQTMGVIGDAQGERRVLWAVRRTNLLAKREVSSSAYRIVTATLHPRLPPSTRLSTASPGEVKGAAFFGETPHEAGRLAKAYVGLSEPFN